MLINKSFRNLKKDEIECRFQSETNGKATYLLYKTARTDVALLTEAYGNRWKNSYESIDGKLYCTISVYDTELKEWVSRSNVGTESNIEKEKGEASDAFKRAGFLWGIGSELYTAPEIKIDITENDKWNGKCNLKLFIKDIEINEDHKITKLVLVDRFGTIRFETPSEKEKSTTNTYTDKSKISSGNNNLDILTTFCTKKKEEGANIDILKKFYDYWKKTIDENSFVGRINPEKLWEKELTYQAKSLKPSI